MKIFNWKKEWFALATLVAGLAITWAWFDDLPAQVPSHWNISGQIDGWTSPTGHALMFVGLMVFMYLLFTAIPYLEPRKENMAKSLGFLNVIKNYMLAFFLGLYTLISYMAVYNAPLAIEKFISVGVGLLFAIIGIHLTKIKSNYFMGIRTPWTLSSDDIWQKTHKLGSTLFLASGILFIASVLLPTPWNFVIPMIGVLIAAIFPILYSYLLFRASNN
jgi:uncharacterized membrane protein